jgi:hypothetical protein
MSVSPSLDSGSVRASMLSLLALLLACSSESPPSSAPSGTSSVASGAQSATGASGGQSGATVGPGASGGTAGEEVGVTTTTTCATAEQSFDWEVYGPVFSRCIGCHNEFGLARQQVLALQLVFPGEPDFAKDNVAILTDYATYPVDTPAGTLPILIAKPTGQVEHVGGEVIVPGSDEARLLASFVDKLANPPVCDQTPADTALQALEELELATPLDTYARAKFVLTGQVATPEELDPLADTEEMLEAKLDELLLAPAFLERAKEMFADWLLTDAYSSLVRGDQLLNQLRDFARNSYYLELCTPEVTNNCCDAATEDCCSEFEADISRCTVEAETFAIDAIAREPLELVKHVVSRDLPLTELLTANYGFVNPYSATVYGLSDAQKGALFDTDPKNDTTEFQLTQLTPTALNELREGPSAGYPHAGVLSMPSTLVRYPSSNSNQQRTRGARLVLERMLAIPVMKLSNFSTAELPADADLELATQEYPACTVCHAAIDPMAANFRSFGNAAEYRPQGTQGRSNTPSHLPPASFLSEVAPADGSVEQLQWLASRVANHPRFALGVLMPVLADLIGAPILTPPTDPLAESYQATYLAYRMQQLEIQRLRRDFVGAYRLRLKPLVKAIVKGPFFRAVATSVTDPVVSQALALAGVGTGTLLTPEQMARKIESVTGLTYRANRDATGRDMFRSFRDYRLMFGGTDWDATAERYREPNAMAVRIALRMSNEMACLSVAQDLAINDPLARRLFRNVTPATTPEAGGEAAIRTEIRRLHRLLLNERLADGDPELEATYNLWVASRAALAAENDGRGGGSFRCGATESYAVEPTAFPDATHSAIDADPDNTIRAWVAVISYLLADGRFFLQ